VCYCCLRSQGCRNARCQVNVWRCLIFVGPRHGTCFLSSFCPYNFEVAPRFLENFCNHGVGHRLGTRVSCFNTSKGQEIFSLLQRIQISFGKQSVYCWMGAEGFHWGYSSQGMKQEFADIYTNVKKACK